MINNSNKYTANTKQNGQVLSADDWNAISTAVATAHTEIETIQSNQGNGNSDNSAAIDTAGVVSVNSKGNTTISATKNINIEPAYDSTGSDAGTYGDVQIKPGDDITLESHHRASSKRDEITVKTSNGQSGASKAPVKLQVIAADMTLSSKGKTGDDPNVMNVNVTTGSGKGYLKVRAQAIDLRCEEHGGIALQPKGKDGQNHMNKIKFEHGGGDGLEFGTFNTEKTSIFTDEYRFNREGVWKMATRQTTASDKADENDATTAYKYVKQADDFYDIIAQDDEQCTTKDIIKTAYAMNGGKSRHTKITNKGAIEIATNPTYTVVIEETPVDPSTATAIGDISTEIAALASVAAGDTFNENDFTAVPTASTVYTNGAQYFSFTEVAAPSIKIESGSELKLGGVLDFGSTFNFGETDNGIEFQNKYTAKGKTKDCGKLKVIAVNNSASTRTFNTLWDPTANDNAGASITETTVNVPAGESRQIAEASIYDIIKLVNYMKSNGQGPWDPSLNL